MDLKAFGVVLIFTFCANAQYDTCDKNLFLNNPGDALTITHSAAVGSCRYKIFGPADTFLEATCTLTSTCGTHVLAFSRNGEKDLSDKLTYCGTGSIPTFKSVANELVIALNAGTTRTASMSCKVVAITQTATNCDCGWSVDTKIVGGTAAKVNGFVSHAVLVDKPTKELFCGTTLSEFFKCLFLK